MGCNRGLYTIELYSFDLVLLQAFHRLLKEMDKKQNCVNRPEKNFILESSAMIVSNQTMEYYGLAGHFYAVHIALPR